MQLKDIPTTEVLEQQQKWWNDNSLPLECGVSIRTAWLTDKGKKLIDI